MNKIEMALEYTDLLAETLKDNLVSAFLYGSVARGTDELESPIDIYSIVEHSPDEASLMGLGRIGRGGLIYGHDDFHLIRCTVKTKSKLTEELNAGLPAEAYFPLKEAIVLYDRDFVKSLKERVVRDEIPLCPFPWSYYLYHGDSRLECFFKNLSEGNSEYMKDDLTAASTFYLQAYFNCRYGLFVISKRDLLSKIREESGELAQLYEEVLEGRSSPEDIGPAVGIKRWVLEQIFKLIP